MRESKESYYEILGVSENCTRDDIKKAYIDRCRNYHPDKLHPDTPEGAKKFIAERMSLINEAYGILKDEAIRKQYDREFNASKYSVKDEPRARQHEASTPRRESSIDELLEPSVLENALLQLELDEKQFDYQLRTNISNIERKYSKHLKTIKKHIPGSLDVVDSSMKLEKSLTYGLAAFIGLWLIPLGISLSLYGWGLFLVFGFLLIKIVMLPVYRSDYVKEVRDEKARRDISVAKFQSNINERVNHFKRIPIHSINRYFIKDLSPRDRLLLVKALKQREDMEKAEKAVQSTVKVATAIGLLAVFLGAIGG
jgi:DnaJ domain